MMWMMIAQMAKASTDKHQGDVSSGTNTGSAGKQMGAAAVSAATGGSKTTGSEPGLEPPKPEAGFAKKTFNNLAQAGANTLGMDSNTNDMSTAKKAGLATVAVAKGSGSHKMSNTPVNLSSPSIASSSNPGQGARSLQAPQQVSPTTTIRPFSDYMNEAFIKMR